MRKISLLLLLAAALGSCKKDNETTPATASKADMLAAKSWRVSAASSTYTINGVPLVTNEYASMTACEKDDFTKFNANKTATFDQGASKCDPSDPQSRSGTWELTANDAKLNIYDPGQGSIAIPFDIISMSATTLQVRNTYSYSANGISATQTTDVTYTAF
jgi:hypothetical protein